jgi:uncharacterized membrane protein YphA (DoxX/SURF4 family)
MNTPYEAAVPASRGAAVWNVAFWVVQVLLGVAFAVGGATKAFQPVAQVAMTAAWAADIPVALLRVIGLAELAGGIGLVLPALTRIRPALTPLAATGLVTIMTFAVVFHLVRGEFSLVPFNLVLGGLAAFVAWGRFRKAPIPPR